LQKCSYGLDKTQNKGKCQTLLNKVKEILNFIKETLLLNCPSFSKSLLLQVQIRICNSQTINLAVDIRRLCLCCKISPYFRTNFSLSFTHSLPDDLFVTYLPCRDISLIAWFLNGTFILHHLQSHLSAQMCVFYVSKKGVNIIHDICLVRKDKF
jgi:hypothetical protein